MQIMSVSGAGGHPPGAVIDRRSPHFLVVTKLVLTRSRIIGRENVAVIETSADLIRIWMISARWFVCVRYTVYQHKLRAGVTRRVFS